MKVRGYEISKGRGISFTDEKKVKVKGSEVNYSLQTIERILQTQSRQLPLKQVEENRSSDNRAASILTAFDQSYSNQNNNPPQEMFPEELLKPEQTDDELSKELLPKKRKKKQRKSWHL